MLSAFIMNTVEAHIRSISRTGVLDASFSCRYPVFFRELILDSLGSGYGSVYRVVLGQRHQKTQEPEC